MRPRTLKTSLIVAVILAASCPIFAQSDTNVYLTPWLVPDGGYPLGVENTNMLGVANTNVQGAVDELYAAVKGGITNVYFVADPLWGNKMHYGGELGAFWKISSNVVTGVRAMYIHGGLLAPEFNATLQLHLHPFAWAGFPKLTVLSFAETGVVLPLSGAKFGSVTIPGKVRDYNGQPAALVGGGIYIPISDNGRYKVGFIGKYEKIYQLPGYLISAGPCIKF